MPSLDVIVCHGSPPHRSSFEPPSPARPRQLLALALMGALATLGCDDGGGATAEGGVSTDASLGDASMGNGGIGGGSGAPPDAGTDAGRGACERAQAAYAAFVDAHLSCAVDDDCTVIGDCGPNADFAAIRLDAAAEGRALQKARCAGAWDGPIFEALCDRGRCTLRQVPETTTMGCPPRWDPDAGEDDDGGAR